MADRPILTLTLNPALDLATHVAEVQAGPKLRCAAPMVNPGGGGLNVSRALLQLGIPSQALVALGGPTGAALRALLQEAGLTFTALASPGDTRQSLAVTDDSTGAQYRFVLPGPVWQTADLAQVLQDIAQHAQIDGLAVLSGSLPPGLAPDTLAQIAAALPGMALVLDSSGASLAHAVANPIPGLAVLRMDSDEAACLAGHPLPSAQHSADLASALVAKGVAATVIIARGAEGNVLARAGQRLLARPPAVPVVSAIGAGDSFVAGLLAAMAKGADWPAALTQGTAAATAAVMTPATDLCRGEDVARLLPQVTLSTL
ncbi:1-phosphofructokinase family hexose kinase [Tabrizicola sp.]|uniref:1-phosphofructokinase family hexose kinase n=1 Tax=Tabrizicola sp. TaxID=2005166 RepID=UPI003D2E5404